MKTHKTIRYIFFVICLCLFLCLVIIKQNKKRKYIQFDYICSSDYCYVGKNFESYKFPKENEFTWWINFAYCNKETVDRINEMYGANFSWSDLKKYWDRNSNIIISFGRELNTIYYDEKVYPNGIFNEGLIIAYPVFKSESIPQKKIYLYISDKKYSIYPMEYLGSDIYEFNYKGNIRFSEE